MAFFCKTFPSLAISVVVFPALLLGGCKSRSAKLSSLRSEGDNAGGEVQGGLSDESFMLWQDYVSSVKDHAATLQRSLQKGCQPMHFSHNPNKPFRGVALLFHGFTACPLQWADFGQLLAEQGYDVLLPLNPGHGFTAGQNGLLNFYQKEYVDDLPDDTNYEQYGQFVQKMTDIVRANPTGDKFVAGLSAGGAMTTLATTLTDPQGNAVFNRALILAPYYFPAAGMGTTILAPFLNPAKNLLSSRLLQGTATLTRDTYIGWDGPLGVAAIADETILKAKSACRDKPGRTGYCAWRVRHLLGATEFGLEALKSATPLNHTQVQFVAAHDDAAIDIGKMLAAYTAMGGRDAALQQNGASDGQGGTNQDGSNVNPTPVGNGGAKVSGCELMSRADIGKLQHSFFSIEDNWKFTTDSEIHANLQPSDPYPTTIVYPEKMFYLKPFYAQALRFALTGQAFDTTNVTTGETPHAPFGACATE